MIKEITLIANKERQSLLFQSVARGLEKHGVRVINKYRGLPLGTKAVACWGWRQGEILRRQGHEVLVFERAYLGDRFHWTSIAWNGLNARGNFCLPDKIDGERFESNFAPLAPWREDGDYILIMGQVIGDMSLQGRDLTKFYEEAAGKLSNKYGKPVYFRPHPHAKPGRNFTPRVECLQNELSEALDRAFAVVTFNSNSGVDAVVRGIPALAMDQGSMAWEVTSHNLDDMLVRPDRTEWANRLAHCQWTPEEIENGDYWERMNANRKT